jgi:hypothetical protein
MDAEQEISLFSKAISLVADVEIKSLGPFAAYKELRMSNGQFKRN